MWWCMRAQTAGVQGARFLWRLIDRRRRGYGDQWVGAFGDRAYLSHDGEYGGGAESDSTGSGRDDGDVGDVDDGNVAGVECTTIDVF